MEAVRLTVLLLVLLVLIGHCSGQKDPPQRFEAKKDGVEKKKAEENARKRAKAAKRGQRLEQRDEQHQKQRSQTKPDPNIHSEDRDSDDMSEAENVDEATVKGNPAIKKIDFNKISANSRAQEIFPWNNLYWKRQQELLQELREEMYIDMEEVFTPKGTHLSIHLAIYFFYAFNFTITLFDSPTYLRTNYLCTW